MLIHLQSMLSPSQRTLHPAIISGCQNAMSSQHSSGFDSGCYTRQCLTVMRICPITQQSFSSLPHTCEAPISRRPCIIVILGYYIPWSSTSLRSILEETYRIYKSTSTKKMITQINLQNIDLNIYL